MLLTLTTTHRPATDLGYLLHKNPARPQVFDLSFGKVHVYYPQADDDRCTAALLLDIDPVHLVRNRRGPAGEGFALEQYVNDRPYVASSFLSVVIAQVLGSALSGLSKERPELAQAAIPLEATLAAVPCRGGEGFLRQLFEPLGYQVSATHHPLDENFPEWGEGPYFTVTLGHTIPLHLLLSHLYVLIPVLDDDKHYWVGEAEVEKLLRHGETWLAAHPLREQITRRYLRHRGYLARQALSRLLEEDQPQPDEAEQQHAAEEEQVEKKLRLNDQRMTTVLSTLQSSGAKTVLDIGCGNGNLLSLLLAEKQFTKIAGMDVSHRALEIAAERLNLSRLPEAQRNRIMLFQGSLTYRDKRLSGHDAAAIVEIIEHLDEPRLAAFERVIFEFARPRLVIVTTPNVEYNVKFETLPAGQFRHRDHRFEWTRQQFGTWAESVANGLITRCGLRGSDLRMRTSDRRRRWRHSKLAELTHLYENPRQGIYSSAQTQGVNMAETFSAIESTLQEQRIFPPDPRFSQQAHIKSMEEYQRQYRESIDDPQGFWGKMAENLHWFKKWDRVLEWNAPNAKWFVDGKLNAAYNCLEAQIERGYGDKAAILWEGEPPAGTAGSGGSVHRITYRQLQDMVSRCANGLKKLGVKRGDRVTIYMPMVPEAAVAMLACARIGAPHSVIFGGFSSQAIADRVEDAKSDIIITADGGYRRGTIVPLKQNVDDALTKTNRVKKVVVLQRIGATVDRPFNINWVEGRDVWWHELMNEQTTDCPAEPMDAEDTLFVLYTSGSTGKPKGIQHTTAGFLLGVQTTSRYVFDLRDDDIFWCTADIGWITGHSYVLYGLLSNGATVLMYEGAPNFPDFSRFWAMIERHRVSVFYTAPTAIRAFMRAGREFVDKHDLRSLRLLGTVGEPINPQAWMWYHEVVGHGNCPIVDTWWQTETGMIMITPIPGATPTKPGTATLPFFGVDAAVVDRAGKEMGPNQGGLLVIRKPWPSMLRGIFNDPDRYQKQYWSDVPNCYFTGDGARRDADGYFWIMGRVDDVINVSGHRLGTMEIESALVAHDAVAEAAVVGIPHEMKGQGIAAFVTLEANRQPTDALKKDLINWVGKQIGSLAKPDQIRFTEALPKTRSGKIMRRLLKEVAAGGEVKGDVTTLEDLNVLAKLKGPEEE